MELSPRHRRALSTGLALLLAIESVSVVAAAAHVRAGRQAGEPVAAAVVTAATTGTGAASPAGDVPAASSSTGRVRLPDAGILELPEASPSPSSPTATKPARPDAPQVPAKLAAANPSPTVRATSSSTATRYSGRNHVWIPSLGINRSLTFFPCDRSRPPDDLVYRWGCAGANNVYLFGHAYSVFKPLHDAYVSHRLKVGMKVYYADARGTVHVYAVRWWKVTPPTTAASWAWAAQATPSMTLQTCVGADSEYRLMVRLAEVKG